jgi:hypothetical protein
MGVFSVEAILGSPLDFVRSFVDIETEAWLGQNVEDGPLDRDSDGTVILSR